MKEKALMIVSLSVALILAGCESMGPKTQTGAVAGGLIGTTAGGIIGYQTGHPLVGAGIGAAVGALSGGLIGSSIDQRDKAAIAVNPNYLPLTKIVEMVKERAPDAVIINEIDRTHSVYQLNSEIITYLKNNKVSDRVIDHMLAAGKN